MVKVDIFRPGFVLQAAIWTACGMAFILFGTRIDCVVRMC
jgi:hypothetical protein